MVSSECKEYVKVDRDDNDQNAQSVDEEGRSMMSQESVGDPPSSSSKRSITTIVVCSFLVGFLLGALTVPMGGSWLGSFRQSIGSEPKSEEMEVPGGENILFEPMEENVNEPVEEETEQYPIGLIDVGAPVEGQSAIIVDEEEEPEEGQMKIQTIISTFTVLEQVNHDESSFTQGLSYGYGNDGKIYIYETTGLYGSSKVRRIISDTFDVEISVDTGGAYFGGGSTFYTDADGNGRLIEITWENQTGFIYDSETLDQLDQFSFTTTAPGHQGWGITYDTSQHEFVVSDGSTYLYFWDRDTLVEKRTVAVTRFDGRDRNRLNELEYMDGLICCNIWHTDEIICVDPMTGKSVREYDMSSLWPANQRGSAENVLNGMALGKDHVLITGKRWDRMYKVVFPDWPTLFDSAFNDEATLDHGVEHNGDDNDRDDMAAVSYNFLRTTKGSQTLHLLLNDLLQPLSPQQQNPSIIEDRSDLSGPRRALTHLSELMKSDGQIHSSCHPIAHNLGRTAYQYFGGLDAAYDGMVGTEDAHLLRLCNAAYLHGVIEFHLRDVDDLNNLASAAREVEENVCNKLTNVAQGPWECRHGIGHGIIQRHRLDAEKDVVQKGIDTCKLTSIAVDCENGLWMDHFAVSGLGLAMENRMMAADVVVAGLMSALSSLDESPQGKDLSTVQKRFQLPPLPPTLQICSLGSNDFGCFIYAATEYLLVHTGDYIGALHYCTDPSASISKLQVTMCVSGVGSALAKEHMDDFSIVEDVCQTLDDESDGFSCFQSAQSYYMTSSGGQSLKEAGLCDNLTRYKSLCY